MFASSWIDERNFTWFTSLEFSAVSCHPGGEVAGLSAALHLYFLATDSRAPTYCASDRPGASVPCHLVFQRGESIHGGLLARCGESEGIVAEL